MSDEMDQKLTAAAAAWRSAQPEPPEPDLERLTERRTASWAPYAVAAGVVVLTAGLAGVAMLGRGDEPPAGPRPDTSTLEVELVRDGDTVEVTGTVLAASGDSVKICELNPSIAVHPPPAPTCSPRAVSLAGTPEGIADWTVTDGVRHTKGQYTVTGIWRDGEIEQQSIRQADSGQGQSISASAGTAEGRFPMPCAAPEGGWRADPPQQVETANGRLVQHVDGRPNAYSGVWAAYPSEGVAVMVVGAVGDLADARRTLRAIYPHNLCVTKVDHSAAELNPAARRLGSADRSWQAEVWPDRARVALTLLVLDQAALDKIGDDADKVIVQPFVRKRAT